jgi:hypothetical protein
MAAGLLVVLHKEFDANDARREHRVRPLDARRCFDLESPHQAQVLFSTANSLLHSLAKMSERSR